MPTLQTWLSLEYWKLASFLFARTTVAWCVFFLNSLFWVVFLWQVLNSLRDASVIVPKRLQTPVTKWVVFVPLTERVTFKTTFQKGNRIQVPKLVRWQFKLEPAQIMRVKVIAVSAFSMQETYYGRISKDGRLIIPRVTRICLRKIRNINLEGQIIDVTLEPV